MSELMRIPHNPTQMERSAAIEVHAPNHFCAGRPKQLGGRIMPYSAEISRSNPTHVIFALDQSLSMDDSFNQSGIRKADFVADVVNRTLHDLVIRCAQPEEVRDYYFISVIGYGASVGPCLGGALRGRTKIPISEIANTPARLENRTKKVSDGAGGLVEQRVRFPVWLDPVANDGTPMCAAFTMVDDILADWVREHEDGFPPVVLHLTDGGSTDGDPSSIAQSIMSKSTSDGSVLLFNCHVTEGNSAKIEYPATVSQLSHALAQMLFSISSPLPAPFQRAGSAVGLQMEEGSRGFVFNGDPVSVAQFFDIGTRPANLR